MQLNTTNLKNLYTRFRTIFFKELHSAEDDMVAMLAMRTQSSAAEEVVSWLGALEGMKEFLGEIQVNNFKAHNYTIPNKEWYDAVGVKQADIERDEAGGIGLYAPRFQIMASMARQHEGERLAFLLCNGFAAPYTCYTGKPFFATDHDPLGNGNTFSNKGTKKLSRDNFRAARKNLRQRKSATGHALKLGKKMVLIVGAENEALGLEILNAERLANGATNVDRGTARLEVWPEIDVINPNAWFLIDESTPMKPLIVQDEKAVDLIAQDKLTDDCMFENHEARYQAYKRQGFGYGMPEVIYGSNGADAA